MKMLLGELRAFLINELAKHDEDYIIDSDDINSAFDTRTNPWSNIRGTDFYVPLRFKDKFDTKGGFKSDVKRAELAQSLNLKPKDILTVLKRSPVTINGVTLHASQTARETAFNKMAKRIAAAYNDQVDVIIYPESSSDMAEQLANRVASDLGGVPVISGAVVKKTAAELEIDADEFAKFEKEALEDGRGQEYVNSARGQVMKTLALWKKKNTRPETKKIPHAWRKFLNLHKTGNVSDLAGKRVLVIDDNVDKAETLTGIKKLLVNAGAKDIMLAAGWDYSERSRSK